MLRNLCRAADAHRPAIENMGVDNGRVEILMVHPVLNGSDVLVSFLQVSRKGIAKRLAACRFGDPSLLNALLPSPLHHTWIKMVTT